MPVVLSISSQVVRGHVGNAAAAPALRALGHEVWPLPTVILSNHPGHGATAGMTVAAETLEAMLGRLEGHGWLDECDAVLSGYFREQEQIRVVADLVRRLKARNPAFVYCCDPVLGDHPQGLYVADEIAKAVCDRLLPLADLAVPNRFELEWLTGSSAGTPAEAVAAARTLDLPEVIVTSVPAEADRIANLWISAEHAAMAMVEPRVHAPHGIGDLVAALALACRLEHDTGDRLVGRITALARHVLEASGSRDELDLVAGLADLDAVVPVDAVPVG